MSKRAIAVYLRVSSSGQDLGSQEPDLKAWLKTHARNRPITWFRDTFTGKTLRRPGMKKLETSINAGHVDTLVVWRLDRLGRTAREMLVFLDQLEAAGVHFVSVRDGVDARSAAGRLMRTILIAFAEYEREVISERILAGIANAKAEGKTWGGKKPGVRSKLTPKRLAAIQALLTARTNKTEIARQLSIDRSTVYEAIAILENSPKIPSKRLTTTTKA